MGRFQSIYTRGLYFAPQIVQALVPLIAVPVITFIDGTGTLALVLSAQALGSVASIALTLGWNISGPSEMAKQEGARDGRLLFESILSKASLVVVVMGLCIGFCFMPAPQAPLLALGFLSSAVVSLSSGWWYVARGQPGLQVVLEVAPRSLLTITGWLVALATLNIIAGLVIQIVASVIATCLSLVYALRLSGRVQYSTTRLVRFLVANRSAWGTQILMQAVASSPLILVTATLPPIAGTFAILDKVQKQIATVMSPVGNIVIAATVRDHREGPTSRAVFERAIRRVLITAAGVTGATAPASVVLIWYMSVATVPPTFTAVGLISLSVGAYYIAFTVPITLLGPLGVLARGNLAIGAGGVISLLLVIPLGSLVGPEGVLAAVTAGFLVVATAQLLMAANAVRRL